MQPSLQPAVGTLRRQGLGDCQDPEIGERLPDFALPDQHGRVVDFHEDRAGSPAAVVFYRSAVW